VHCSSVLPPPGRAFSFICAALPRACCAAPSRACFFFHLPVQHCGDCSDNVLEGLCAPIERAAAAVANNL
jgi:hypothetical protein